MHHSPIIHVLLCSKLHSPIHLDMVETRGIRKAREFLHRNRYRVRLEEGIVDSYLPIIVERRRHKLLKGLPRMPSKSN